MLCCSKKFTICLSETEFLCKSDVTLGNIQSNLPGCHLQDWIVFVNTIMSFNLLNICIKAVVIHWLYDIFRIDYYLVHLASPTCPSVPSVNTVQKKESVHHVEHLIIV